MLFPRFSAFYYFFFRRRAEAGRFPVDDFPFFVGFFLAHPHFGSAMAMLAACATVFMMAALWFGLLGFAFVRSRSLWYFEALGGWLKYSIALGLLAYAVLALMRLASG